MSTNQHESQVALPGLELDPKLGAPSALRKAVVVTLAALERDGLLEERHSAIAQLALELADAVAQGTGRGRASAAAMAAAQLLAVLQSLPAPMAADVQQKFDQLVQGLLNSEQP